ncbi:uncharacterized protein RHO25_006266 [Cercospora beticola]|uniref:2EXR domain-containing protein n=1 Tax=Cercospora beticola TaxID=122368 RepID=A0ABZ0NQ08_CERBT|nr:hypothetical protein RHO25_006266 [Cercospora beticola]
MDASPLGALAAELRNMIWELAVTHDDHILVAPRSCGNNTEHKASSTRNEHVTAMLAVCKQMRSECSALFYSLNTFEVRTGCHNWRDTSSITAKFYKSIGHQNRQNVRSMYFSITLSDCPTREPSEEESRNAVSKEMRWFREVRDDLASIVSKIAGIKRKRPMKSLQADLNLQNPSSNEFNGWYTFQLDFLNVKASFENDCLLQKRRWPRSIHWAWSEFHALDRAAVAQLVWARYCHSRWQN